MAATEVAGPSWLMVVAESTGARRSIGATQSWAKLVDARSASLSFAAAVTTSRGTVGS